MTIIRKMSRKVLLLAVAAVLTGSAYGQLPAFPGAEGAGSFTSGGRGTSAVPTTVFEVTTLYDTTAAGSLRAAINATATHRTIVFRVSGTIHLKSPLKINKANTTLAGQTAPGGGICIADHPVSVSANNVIIRHIRFRLGDRFQNLGMVNGSGDGDALDGTGVKNIMIDHCSMSWSSDEACTFYRGDSITLQWNIISEPLNYSYHFETGDTDFQRHGYGGIWGGRNASFHHNLIAHCLGRTPRFDGSRNLPPYTAGQENADFRNNVLYNWGNYSNNGGEGGNYNIINNYYKYGPDTRTNSSVGVPVRAMILNPYKQTSAPILPYGKYFVEGNYVDGNAAVTANNWQGVSMSGGAQADTALAKMVTAFNALPVTTYSAVANYDSVLAKAGAILPLRDSVDMRIVGDVINRTGKIIDVQGDFLHGTPYAQTVGAWPELVNYFAPIDTDKDGMPDAWEIANGLNPNSAADRQLIASNGYTNLENYLNGISGQTGTSTQPSQVVNTVQGKTGFIQVYPNPVKDVLKFTFATAANGASLAMYTQAGAFVNTWYIPQGTTEYSLQVQDLPAGMYVLQLNNGNTTTATKFIKQ
jgi:hypothetical protein